MGLEREPTDNRGISEIYGTILIFALVFITAVALVGVGLFVLNDTTTNANDRLAQDSVLELDDRLTQLTEEDVENSITWEVPQGTAEDFAANGSQGSINVTARTNDTYWDASRGAPGGLVDASTQLNSREVTLGTITHEGQDGVLTVYQGGGVLEVQDGSVTVLREPDVSVTDGNLVLDFVNISSIENIDDSTLEATQRGDRTDTEAIQRLVNRAMQRDGDVIAPAEINITVTSRFADGWGKLVKESVDSRPVTVWDSDDLSELDENQVRIGFGEFGEGIDLPDGSPPWYGSDVMYSGIADLAPELYDDITGTIDEDGDGFEVTEVDGLANSNYTVGLRYDAGNGPNWWKWDPSAGEWANIEDPTVGNLPAGAPDPVTSVSGDTFQIADEAWTCVVSGDSLRDHVDEGGKGCFVEPVGVESPDDSVGDFRPLLNITTLDVDGPSDRQLEYGNESVTVDVRVTNDGTAAADDGEPVGVVIDPTASDAWIGNGTRLKGANSLARGSTREFSFTYTPNFVGQKFRVGGGTPDDSTFDGTLWEVVKTPDAQDFEIQDVDVLNGPVVAGDTLKVDVRVYNNGSSADTQDVIISNAAGPQATEEYDLNSGETVKKTIEWETEVGDGTPGPTTINVTTLTDRESTQANVQPPGSTFANFQIQDVDIDTTVQEGNDLEAEVEITNTGGDDGTRTIRLRDQSGVIRATVTGVTLNSGQTVTLGAGEPPLVWDTELGDAGVYDLTVETDDDTNTTTGVQVTSPPGANTFNVSIDDAALSDVIAGDNLDVPVEIEYNGGGTRTESIWLGNFDGEPVDAETVTLTSGSTVTRTLTWETEGGDGQEDPGTVTANGVGDTDSASVEVRPEDEAGPSYSITSFTTNSSTAPDGSLPADPTVEGQDLEIDLTVENTGPVLGTETVVVEYAPENRPIATTEVTVPSGGSTTVDLTWETVIGDNTTTEANADNAEDLEVEIAGNTEREEVFIDRQTTTRDPVDVMFAIDETGSMGDLRVGGMEPTPQEEIDSGIYEVGTDLSFGEVVVPHGEVFWYDLYDGEFLDKGEEFYTSGTEIWPGKKITNKTTVPADADMWFVTPVTSSDVTNYYVSGQTVDPADHGGTAYVFELDKDGCGCNDPTGQRYDAVQTALDTLDPSLGDRAGLLEFNLDQNVYQPVTNNIGAVKESLRVNPGGGTDITEAIFAAQNRLDGLSDPNKKSIVLLTDGKHNAGDSLPPSDRVDDIDGDVTMYVVGFGNADTSADSDLAKVAAAGTGDGKLYDGNEDDLEDIFARIGEELNEPDLPSVQVSTSSSYTVKEGETLQVPVSVENTGEAGERIITLTDIYGNIVDSTTVTLAAGETITASDPSAPILEWTADLQGSDEPPTSGELLVRTPDSEATPDVTVTEGAPSNFVVDEIVSVTPTSPQATDEIEMTVEIENRQPGADNQTVIMRDDDGNPVDVKTITLSGVGGPNERTTATFRWQTRSSDAGMDKTMTIETEDHTNSTTVDIAPAPGTNDEFDVDIVGINSSVTAGDALEVQIQAENVGTDPGKRFVELYDFDNRTVDLTETSELSPGGTETFNLTWNTEAGDGDTDDIYVVTRDDEVGQEVTVQSVTGPDANFEIASAATLTDPVTAGDDVEVEMVVENTGTDPDSQFVEAEFNGLTKTENITVAPSSTQTVTFEYGTASGLVNSPTTFDIELRTEDDSTTTPVTVEPAPSSTLTVDILSTSGPVEAGEQLDVVVEVTGLSSESTLSLETPYGSPLRPADVETIASDGTYTLTWSTLVGQGDSDPQEIVVRVEGVTDTTQVTVEEAPEGDVVAPGTGPDSDPVGIDIEEIKVE